MKVIEFFEATLLAIGSAILFVFAILWMMFKMGFELIKSR
jgi:hypothetical protein